MKKDKQLNNKRILSHKCDPLLKIEGELKNTSKHCVYFAKQLIRRHA